MASPQTSLKTPFKDLTSFKGNMKRLYRERLEDAPIKKRVMAEMHLKRRSLESIPKPPKVKKEREEHARSEMDIEGREFHLVGASKALDLSAGLKHTLAQFTLSSQSSLGGPAAFSAKSVQECASPAGMAPLPSPPVLGGGPLLVPCDSSTELTHSLLEGESISCFVVGGEKRLCLPQVLNSVLRDFSLQQINAVCDELYVYCSRCDAEQLHILKVLGILPFNAPSCGLITLTDAQRLCNALLRPGAALPANPNSKLPGQGLLKESEANFQVEHQCLGKCQGLFVPQFYVQPDAPCIQCMECQLLFSPQNFVMHSHKSPDKRTCHWGFDSAKWPCYLQLGRKHEDTPEEPQLKQLLDEMKEKFHYQLKRPLDEKVVDDNCQGKKSSPAPCPPNSKLSDGILEKKLPSKGNMQSSMTFSRLFPDIKEEPEHSPIVHPSYYLYTYDKMVAPNVSLRKEGEVSHEVLGALLKQHYSRRTLVHDNHPTTDLPGSHSSIAEEAKSHHAGEANERRRPSPSVAMETSPGGKQHAPIPMEGKDSGAEDDKDRIMLEIVQMYRRQQEKLNSTLQKQLQLEMELEAVRGGEAARLRELSAEQLELQNELEAVHTEHAQRLGEVRQEQRQLEHRLEQLRQQSCACQPKEQEAQYNAQLCELRCRLERAEVERQELQEELCRERESREKLELMISQLQLQTAQSGTKGSRSSSPAHPPTPSASPQSQHSLSSPCPEVSSR
ncbi:ski-like protein isoform X1 [Carassius gibelio]|uniref:ski-like protein isoform X1 n=1 Tax=Carassius gibelio TaxID=101364 RepID=UPI002279B803|nr:ski-like protein isoform X1 [Carassius gibelio]XP_052475889.1 ski-like protein isoform X1 [Carassius gibelio]